MSSEQYRERGIQAAKERRMDEARKLLQQALRLNPQDELAWLYLATTTQDKKERLLYLQKVLEINRDNELARKSLAAMGISVDQLLQAKPGGTPAAPPPPEPPAAPKPLASVKPPTPTPAAPPPTAVPDYLADLDDDDDEEISDSDIPDYLRDLDIDDEDAFEDTVPAFGADEDIDWDDDPFEDQQQDDIPTLTLATNPLTDVAQPDLMTQGNMPVPPAAAPAAPGVPIPSEQYLSQVIDYVQPLAEAYLTPPADEVEWIRKTRGRAGERDIWTLRLQIAGAVISSLVVLGIVGLLIVNNVPEVRRIVFAATRTPTLTPSVTPTNTPGTTPTASPTLDTTKFPTYTPSPTLPLTITPQARVNVTPRPTALNLPLNPERGIVDSVFLMNAGNFEEAIPTLEAERQFGGTVFNPNPYYFEALARARSGDTQGAFQLMQTAETALEGQSARDITLYSPLVNLGFAEVFFQQGLDALARNSPVEANQRFSEAQSRLEDAIEINPRLARAHELLGDTYTYQGEYSTAIQTLNAAQELPELASDVSLILAKGRAFMAEANDLLVRGDTENARAQFEQADYQAFYALYINPYQQEAHQLRIESALARNQPGLAVLYCQTYLLYYPNNPSALRYLGDARLAENNGDLALQAYSQALDTAGETTSPDLINALVARAGFYEQERRFDLALADYTRAFESSGDTAIQAKRMLTAYALGDLETAASDAEALTGTGALPEAEISLLKARVIIDQANPTGETVYQDALALLNTISDGALTPELAGITNQYRAVANFRLNNLDAALTNIDAALGFAETGTRYYLRGQINEASGNFAAAARDYEWIITWDSVYGYEFTEDAATRLSTVQEAVEAAAAETATAEFAGTVTPTATP